MFRPIRIKRTDPRALTERCKRPGDFKRVVLGDVLSPLETARHLASCPTCRRFVVEATRGALAEGKPLSPDPGTVAMAKKRLAELEAKGTAEEKLKSIGMTPSFTVRLADPVGITAPESAVVRESPRPGGVSRVATAALGYVAELAFERTAPGRFLLRLRGTPPGVVVRLHRVATADGKYAPVDAGQRSALAVWRGLSAGRYRLVAVSNIGERALELVVTK